MVIPHGDFVYIYINIVVAATCPIAIAFYVSLIRCAQSQATRKYHLMCLVRSRVRPNANTALFIYLFIL